ncbi:MAG TPA: glycosyltransferase family 39 protein [Pyrinomonadaceae bacterium]|nr:glycosyltransferase family 39 protein [Pyrinomonadaceae bacterium]
MMRFVAADAIHPPLFYALLRVWTRLGGESLLWLRLFPVAFAVAGIVPFVLLARGLRLSFGETNVALLVLAANGYLIKYSQEVRMYAPLFALGTTSLWLFVRYLNTPHADVRATDDDGARVDKGATRRSLAALVALFVANLLLVYTHYYGWLVVAAQLFFLLLSRRRRRLFAPFAASLAALAACFAPWVYAVARATAAESQGVRQNLGWIARPSPGDLLGFLTQLGDPFYFRQSNVEPLHTRFGFAAVLLLLVLPVAALVVRQLRRGGGDDVDETSAVPASKGVGEGERWALLFCFLLVPVALAFALSWLLPLSVWGTRHLVTVAAPYALLAGAGAWRLRPVLLSRVLVAAIVCWFALVGAVVSARREGPFIWCAWEGLAARAALAESPGPVEVYAFEDLVAYHLWFASARRNGNVRVAVVKNVAGLRDDPAYFLPRAFRGVRVTDAEALAGEEFFVAFRDAAWRESRPPLKILLERGYSVEQVHEEAAQGQRAFLARVRRGLKQ